MFHALAYVFSPVLVILDRVSKMVRVVRQSSLAWLVVSQTRWHSTVVMGVELSEISLSFFTCLHERDYI